MPIGKDDNGTSDGDEYEGRDRPEREYEEGERREPRRGRRRERSHEESFDDPDEHREIERSRFSGGLAATPELYALAREQWYRLPGAVVRPPMDPIVGDRAPDEPPAPEPAHPGETQPER